MCVNVYYTELGKLTREEKGSMIIDMALFYSINFALRVITVRSPADQHGGIPPHQTQRETLEQVPCSLILLLASVPG